MIWRIVSLALGHPRDGHTRDRPFLAGHTRDCLIPRERGHTRDEIASAGHTRDVPPVPRILRGTKKLWSEGPLQCTTTDDPFFLKQFFFDFSENWYD